jgi:hypothetical protein
MVKKVRPRAVSVDNGRLSVAKIELNNANIDSDIISLLFTLINLYGLCIAFISKNHIEYGQYEYNKDTFRDVSSRCNRDR